MTVKTGVPDATPPLPIALAAWIKERHFDICPWLAAPSESYKIIGKDAWRCGKVVLIRVPMDNDAGEIRYYATICQGPERGQAVGYWLEVLSVTGTDAGR